MTQQEAILFLRRLKAGRNAAALSLVSPGDEETRCTGDVETCPVDECMLCAIRECPGREPLHYHHDGCPYCCVAEDDLTEL